MLVLSRRKNETVNFPELKISVEILQVKGSTVRLGIKAPRDIRVLRGELDFSSEWDDYEIEVPMQQSKQLLESVA